VFRYLSDVMLIELLMREDTHDRLPKNVFLTPYMETAISICVWHQHLNGRAIKMTLQCTIFKPNQKYGMNQLIIMKQNI